MPPSKHDPSLPIPCGARSFLAPPQLLLRHVASWLSLGLAAWGCGSADPAEDRGVQEALETRAYVVSEQSDQLFVADVQSLTEVGVVGTRVGEGVNSNHMAVVSSDAQKIYVVASAKDAVVVVDAQTLSVLTTISTGAHPTHASVCPGCSATGGDELWLVNEGHAHDGESAEPGTPHEGSISVIDMQTDHVTDTLVDSSLVVPHFVRFSAGSAYVPSIGGNQITVIDVETHRVSDVLLLEGASAPGPCSADPCGFADAQIDQNGLLVSAHIESGQVLVYDTLAHQRKQDILGGSRPWAVFVDLEDNSFDTYLMPNWDDSSVSLIDRKLHAEVARSLEGDQESYGVNYSRLAPGEAFVLNRQKERVAVIDRQTGASIDSLAVGGTTETASTTADGRYLLLPLSSTNQFAIWDIVQREEVALFEGVGEYPWSVATTGGQNYCH
jgi:YVTN family beta-propeller protein